MDAVADPLKLRKKSRALNKTLTLKLAHEGLNNQAIANLQGVDQSTVWYFLKQVKAEITQVNEFKEHRADALAAFQGKCLNLQNKLIDSMLKDGFLEPLKQSEKTGLLMALNASAGTSFDKERLERGKSTENVQVLNKLITEAHSTLFTPAKLTSKVASRPASVEQDDQ